MKKNIQKKEGFALLISIITTGILLVVSFVVINIALKQLLITQASQASQTAFYVADSGIECAEYWDLKNGAISAFDTTTPGTITCNGQTVTTGSQTTPVSSVIGGATVSIFSINFANPVSSGNICAIVQVTKSAVIPNTTIESKGYNTCDTTVPRRFERAIRITY